IAFSEAIIEEREQGIQEIQQQIGEVNENFKDLVVLVHEQGALIDDIGSNIEQSHATTAQARSQLAKASKTQRSNSSLMLGVGAVLPPPSSSSELNPAIRSEVSFSVGSCLLPHPDKIFGLEIAAYSSMIDWDICAYLCFSFFTSSLLKSTYDYIIALTEQEQEQQGVGGQQSPQMSTVSSLIGFSSASFFTMFQCGSWCTPPHLFDEDRVTFFLIHKEAYFTKWWKVLCRIDKELISDISFQWSSTFKEGVSFPFFSDIKIGTIYLPSVSTAYLS
ncbi:hypothetical protein S245_012272, partial [Arachis hypogaea]